jgi:hypothetical protein
MINYTECEGRMSILSARQTAVAPPPEISQLTESDTQGNLALMIGLPVGILVLTLVVVFVDRLTARRLKKIRAQRENMARALEQHGGSHQDPYLPPNPFEYTNMTKNQLKAELERALRSLQGKTLLIKLMGSQIELLTAEIDSCGAAAGGHKSSKYLRRQTGSLIRHSQSTIQTKTVDGIELQEIAID